MLVSRLRIIQHFNLDTSRLAQREWPPAPQSTFRRGVSSSGGYRPTQPNGTVSQAMPLNSFEGESMKHHRNQLFKIALLMIAVALSFVFAAAVATAQTYTPLYTYPIGSGSYSGITWPSVLAQGQDGNLYSTIQNNGSTNAGSVYKMTPAGGYTLIYNFCAEGGSCLLTGGYPIGGVTLGFDGNLWGTTPNGGKAAAGTVFKVTPAGTLTKVYDFTNGKDDSAPNYTVVQGQDGNIYAVSEEQYNTQYGSFL